MEDRQRRSDRKRLAWIAVYFAVGFVFLVAAFLWSELVEPRLPAGSGSGPGRRDVAFGLAVVGVITFVLGAGELAHRVWRGPQKPGRHTRD